MNVERAEFHPEWTNDCQGKKDYDCTVVSLSCRYYPRGGGFWLVNTNDGTIKENDSRPEIRPSAVAHILLGDTTSGPYEDLAMAEFEGDSEDIVKQMVEDWAEEMMERVSKAVRAEFSKQ